MRKREILYMAIVVALILVRFEDDMATAHRVREVTEIKTDVRPCDGLWIRQCAAGECWSPDSPPLACSPGSDLTRPRALPSHILTSPL